MTDQTFHWPVDPAVLPGFLLAMALVELTPGPNMGYLAVIAAGRGRFAAAMSVVGVTLGLSIYLGLAVYGVTQGVMAAPTALTVLHWGGVLYLLFLAVEALGTPAVPVSTTASTGGLMLRGLIANLLNPKALLFYAVLLPGFVRTGFGPAWVQMLTLGLGHIAISIIVHLGIVFGVAQAVSAWPASRRRALRWLSAGGLVAVALWLAVSY